MEDRPRTVRLEVNAGFTRLTFDNPRRPNAITAACAGAMVQPRLPFECGCKESDRGMTGGECREWTAEPCFLAPQGWLLPAPCGLLPPRGPIPAGRSAW